MKTKILVFGVLFVVLVATSCRKDDIEPPQIQKPQSMDQLVANQSFDWKTTRDYQFIVNGSYNAAIKITSPGGCVYHKGFVKTNLPYKVTLTLPSYETKVQLNYFGKNIEVALNQAVINYTFSTK